MRRATLACFFVIIFAPGARSDDLQTIQKLNGRLSEAFNSRDSAGIARLYTDDAVLMPPSAKLIKGKVDIEQYWKRVNRQASDVTTLTTVSVTFSSESETGEIGTFTSKVKGAHGRATTGKFMIVWRKVGDDWKIATDIWNFD
jgi:uncharacterized protein (TIGR02246 family)